MLPLTRHIEALAFLVRRDLPPDIMTEARRAPHMLAEGALLGGLERVVERGIGILRSPRAWHLFAAILLLYNSAGHLLLWNIGGGDYWEHLATFHAFARNPLHPDNPYVARAEPTHLFTPYHLFWGVMARLLGMHPMDVLPLAGAANTLVFLAACRVLARRLLGDPHWALPLALTLLTFWFKPWTWSGFYNLGFLPIASIYPFWFALPLAWITAASYPVEPTAAIPGRGRAFLAAPIAALVVALVFLIHPVSGIFLVVALLALGLGTRGLPARAPTRPPRRARSWGSGSRSSGPTTPSSRRCARRGNSTIAASPVISASSTTGPGSASCPRGSDCRSSSARSAGGDGIRSRPASSSSSRSTGSTTSRCASSTLARSIIFVAFFLHLAVVQGLRRDASVPSARAVHESLFLAFLALFGALEGYESATRLGPFHDWKAGAPLGQHSNRRVLTRLIALDRFVRPADVVMAPLAESWLLPGALGCKVVGVRHSNPFLGDYAERSADTERFFAAESSAADRDALIAKYGVRFVLVPAGSTWRPSGAGGQSLAAEDGAFALYAVTAAAEQNAPPVMPERWRDPARPESGSSP